MAMSSTHPSASILHVHALFSNIPKNHSDHRLIVPLVSSESGRWCSIPWSLGVAVQYQFDEHNRNKCHPWGLAIVQDIPLRRQRRGSGARPRTPW